MGYFGSNDVCFNVWLLVLVGIFKAIQSNEDGLYEFDQGAGATRLYIQSRGRKHRALDSGESNVVMDLVIPIGRTLPLV